MIDEKGIKKDLKDIRFYYENYEMFCFVMPLARLEKIGL